MRSPRPVEPPIGEGIQPMRRRFARPGRSAGLLTLAVIFIGCAEERDPETWPNVAVSGRVRVGEQPLEGGWIEFLPIDGTVGVLGSARMDRCGRFRVEQVPAGRVGIRLVGFAPIVPEDRMVGVFLQQVRQVFLIHRVIEEASGTGVDLDLDLTVEAYQPRGGTS